MTGQQTVNQAISTNGTLDKPLLNPFDQVEIEDSQLEVEAMKRKVKYLGICFMVMFSSFNATQNLVMTLYKQLGYANLGSVSLFALYIAFAIASLFAKFVVERKPFRQVFICSNICYAFFVICGIWVSSCSTYEEGSVYCQTEMIYLVVITGSMLCGIGSSTLWVAQGAYIQTICQRVPTAKGQIYGIFWSTRMSSHIIGNILAMLIFQISDDRLVYFAVMSFVMLLSIILFSFVEPIKPISQSSKQQAETVRISEQVKRVFALIATKSFLPIIFLTITGGLNLSICSGFLRRLVSSVSDELNEKDVGNRLSFVLIAFGCFEIVGGKIAGFALDRINAYTVATISVLLALGGLIMMLVGLLADSYTMCFFIGSIIGFADCFINSVSQFIQGHDYPGRLEVFQATRFITSNSTSLTQLLILFTSDEPPFVFLSIVAAIYLISIFIVSLFPSLSKHNRIVSVA